eukprot:6186383-Pleurochrysis_carterae.AAC.7
MRSWEARRLASLGLPSVPSSHDVGSSLLARSTAPASPSVAAAARPPLQRLPSQPHCSNRLLQWHPLRPPLVLITNRATSHANGSPWHSDSTAGLPCTRSCGAAAPLRGSIVSTPVSIPLPSCNKRFTETGITSPFTALCSCNISLARPLVSDSRTTSLPAVKSTVRCPRILIAIHIPERFQALASRLPQSTSPTGTDSSALRVAVPARLAAFTARRLQRRCGLRRTAREHLTSLLARWRRHRARVQRSACHVTNAVDVYVRSSLAISRSASLVLRD